jgi:hypothetical protein
MKHYRYHPLSLQGKANHLALFDKLKKNTGTSVIDGYKGCRSLLIPATVNRVSDNGDIADCPEGDLPVWDKMIRILI